MTNTTDTSRTTVALVTGANKGIGYEITAGLARLGCTVAVGARDPQRGQQAVAKLQEAGHDVFGVVLDVTDDASVNAALDQIAERTGRLDVLVNNAGVTGGWPQEPTTMSTDTVRAAVETNVIGVVRVTNAALPMLRQAPSPRIVNLSSHVSSLGLQTNPDVDLGGVTGAYAPSKAMLNAVTIAYVKELDGSGILMNNACPGYVQTDFNGGDGAVTAEQGAAVVIRLATLPDGSPTGQLVDDSGPVPW